MPSSTKSLNINTKVPKERQWIWACIVLQNIIISPLPADTKQLKVDILSDNMYDFLNLGIFVRGYTR